MGNRDSTLKGHTQNPTHSGTQGISSQFERSLGQTHLLGKPSGEMGCDGTHPGDPDTGSSHFGELLVP